MHTVQLISFFFDGLRRKHTLCAATRRRRQGALFRERPLQPRAAGGAAPRPPVNFLFIPIASLKRHPWRYIDAPADVVSSGEFLAYHDDLRRVAAQNMRLRRKPSPKTDG